MKHTFLPLIPMKSFRKYLLQGRARRKWCGTARGTITENPSLHPGHGFWIVDRIHIDICPTIKQHKGLHWWGCLVSCTGKMMKYARWSPVGGMDLCVKSFSDSKTQQHNHFFMQYWSLSECDLRQENTQHPHSFEWRNCVNLASHWRTVRQILGIILFLTWVWSELIICPNFSVVWGGHRHNLNSSDWLSVLDFKIL